MFRYFVYLVIWVLGARAMTNHFRSLVFDIQFKNSEDGNLSSWYTLLRAHGIPSEDRKCTQFEKLLEEVNIYYHMAYMTCMELQPEQSAIQNQTVKLRLFFEEVKFQLGSDSQKCRQNISKDLEQLLLRRTPNLKAKSLVTLKALPMNEVLSMYLLELEVLDHPETEEHEKEMLLRKDLLDRWAFPIHLTSVENKAYDEMVIYISKDQMDAQNITEQFFMRNITEATLRAKKTDFSETNIVSIKSCAPHNHVSEYDDDQIELVTHACVHWITKDLLTFSVHGSRDWDGMTLREHFRTAIQELNITPTPIGSFLGDFDLYEVNPEHVGYVYFDADEKDAASIGSALMRQLNRSYTSSGDSIKFIEVFHQPCMYSTKKFPVKEYHLHVGLDKKASGQMTLTHNDLKRMEEDAKIKLEEWLRDAGPSEILDSRVERLNGVMGKITLRYIIILDRISHARKREDQEKVFEDLEDYISHGPSIEGSLHVDHSESYFDNVQVVCREPLADKLSRLLKVINMTDEKVMVKNSDQKSKVQFTALLPSSGAVIQFSLQWLLVHVALLQICAIVSTV